MGVSYIKLFKLLLEKKMKKGDLCKAAGISGSSLAKLYRGESVTTIRALEKETEGLLEEALGI